MGMKEFGELVRITRERKNIRAYDLAYAIKQNPSWVSRLESGMITHPPSPSVMSGLAEFLGISEMEMFAAMGYRPSQNESTDSDPTGASIARAVEGWTPRQKKLLWQYIEAVSTALDESDAGDES